VSDIDIKTLGRYKIQGVLGKGAMGLVYDGVDPKLNRRVAIKTILTRKLSPEAAKMATVRFQREVRAVARLNHGNIVQVYDFGSEGDLAFIVMEFVQGKELKDSLTGTERFDLGRVFRLMGELLDALHFAHEAGIIHRDVKPANIMLTAAGQAKLADFGVAREETWHLHQKRFEFLAERVLKGGEWQHAWPARAPQSALVLRRQGLIADYVICGEMWCLPLEKLMPRSRAPVVQIAPC